MIDHNEVERVARLARLRLTSDEARAFSEKLSAILGYFEALSQIPTDGVEPLVTPTDIAAHLRPDEMRTDLTVDQALQNAPEKVGHLFKVPPVV